MKANSTTKIDQQGEPIYYATVTIPIRIYGERGTEDQVEAEAKKKFEPQGGIVKKMIPSLIFKVSQKQHPYFARGWIIVVKEKYGSRIKNYEAYIVPKTAPFKFKSGKQIQAEADGAQIYFSADDVLITPDGKVTWKNGGYRGVLDPRGLLDPREQTSKPNTLSKKQTKKIVEALGNN